MAGRIFLQIDEGKCTGCQSCQLICSIIHAEVFNPAAARGHVSTGEPKITFGPECTHCGVCASYCLYGALTAVEEKG